MRPYIVCPCPGIATGGAYLDKVSSAFADLLRAQARDYAENMLEAENRKLGELRKILGKIG